MTKDGDEKVSDSGQRNKMKEEEKEEENILQNWYKKRRLSLVVIYVHNCLYMFEISAINISAFYYFKYTLKSPNPRLYFSLVTTAVFVLAPFSAVLVGRYVDRTRDLRKTLFVSTLFNVAGNLMYIFPVYDWFPIAGRILCGVPEGIKSAFKGVYILVLFTYYKNCYVLELFCMKQFINN